MINGTKINGYSLKGAGLREILKMKNNKDEVRAEVRVQIEDNVKVAGKLIEGYLDAITEAADRIIRAIKDGNKLMLCGNGGSAADAQHIAAEFVNRFRKERRPLAAIALTTDSSVLTSISNDYDYRYCFSKQIKALGKQGDVLVAISTSGQADNVIEAAVAAGEMDIYTIGLTGAGGGQLQDVASFCIKVPSQETPRIQEAHILIGHLICDIIEKAVC